MTQQFVLAKIVQEPTPPLLARTFCSASANCVCVDLLNVLSCQDDGTIISLTACYIHTLHRASISKRAAPRTRWCNRCITWFNRQDEVLRSLRLTAVLRTLDSRSPSPLHVVKLQANCKPAFFFFFFYMWVTPVNSGVRNWSPIQKQNKTIQNEQIWMIPTIQCGNLSWWLWRVWRLLQFPFTSSALLQCIVKQHCGVTTVSGTQQCGGQTERLSLVLRYQGMEMLVPV